MLKLNTYILILFLFPIIILSQSVTTKVVDSGNEKPISEIQVLSDSGSQIGFTDENGIFTLNLSEVKKNGINDVTFYHRNYASQQYSIDKIPITISLDKVHDIEPVVISGNKKGDYFVLHGYFRSWKVINNELVKYNDGLISYYIPYSSKKTIETNIENYRTLKKDNYKDKVKGIISLGDGYLYYKIPKNDKANIYDNNKYFKLEKLNDSTSILYSKNKNDVFIKRGKILYDKNHLIKEVQKNISFEKDEAFKVLLWKATGQFYNLEKWEGEGNSRHVSYVFDRQKSLVKDSIEETINEIFIDNVNFNNVTVPQKTNTKVDKDKSYYDTLFWNENIKIHPLPLNIQNQIENLKIAPNNLKK
ncbi:hypothetical protein DRF65_06900 [Chryseobacterium pennae]|uniref:Carboxypeptidase-like regulatory domain-containing protein n=1 Tax=Chryseobacterium pennae TaxID=2258962 RepID=A0A3D9CB49_9FLAO|nr:hypothetical protein [Chryseobacterium pennae]REC62958.1 hypothetical protein DRF65_06900 [Chryseobacterium pennae]